MQVSHIPDLRHMLYSLRRITVRSKSNELGRILMFAGIQITTVRLRTAFHHGKYKEFNTENLAKRTYSYKRYLNV